MARQVRDCRIDSRSARLKLLPQAEPYWRKISKGCFIGYRRSTDGGNWVARYRDLAGRQNFRTLAAADDFMDAQSGAVANFDKAQEMAREWFGVMAAGGIENRHRGAYTVAQCMKDYLDWIKLHRKSHAHLDTYINAYILPQLGSVDTAKLTAPIIRKWHQSIAIEAPRLRTPKGKVQRYRAEDPDEAEAKRKRRLRANRHLVTLRAALNRAWKEGLIARNDPWARVELFPGTERSRSRILDRDEARRLLNACPVDLRRLVRLALLSGARFGELAALQVRDFNKDSGTLHIRESKSGKTRHIVLNSEGVQFCRDITAGRSQDLPLLSKDDGTSWRRDHQHRPFKEAVRQSGLDEAFTFHELRHTWASLTIMAGAPLIVVAQNLGHRDTRMVEQHYGHLANSWVAEVIRNTAPSFGLDGEAKIVSLGLS